MRSCAWASCYSFRANCSSLCASCSFWQGEEVLAARACSASLSLLSSLVRQAQDWLSLCQSSSLMCFRESFYTEYTNISYNLARYYSSSVCNCYIYSWRADISSVEAPGAGEVAYILSRGSDSLGERGVYLEESGALSMFLSCVSSHSRYALSLARASISSASCWFCCMSQILVRSASTRCCFRSSSPSCAFSDSCNSAISPCRLILSTFSCLLSSSFFYISAFSCLICQLRSLLWLSSSISYLQLSGRMFSVLPQGASCFRTYSSAYLSRESSERLAIYWSLTSSMEFRQETLEFSRSLSDWAISAYYCRALIQERSFSFSALVARSFSARLSVYCLIDSAFERTLFRASSASVLFCYNSAIQSSASANFPISSSASLSLSNSLSFNLSFSDNFCFSSLFSVQRASFAWEIGASYQIFWSFSSRAVFSLVASSCAAESFSQRGVTTLSQARVRFSMVRCISSKLSFASLRAVCNWPLVSSLAVSSLSSSLAFMTSLTNFSVRSLTPFASSFSLSRVSLPDSLSCSSRCFCSASFQEVILSTFASFWFSLSWSCWISPCLSQSCLTDDADCSVAYCWRMLLSRLTDQRADQRNRSTSRNWMTFAYSSMNFSCYSSKGLAQSCSSKVRFFSSKSAFSLVSSVDFCYRSLFLAWSQLFCCQSQAALQEISLLLSSKTVLVYLRAEVQPQSYAFLVYRNLFFFYRALHSPSKAFFACWRAFF